MSGDWKWKRGHGNGTEARSQSDGTATGAYNWRASPRLYTLHSYGRVWREHACYEKVVIHNIRQCNNAPKVSRLSCGPVSIAF